MKAKLKSMQPRAVLYARAMGPYAKSAPEAWRQLTDWLVERDLRQKVVTGYGWFRDYPATISPFLQRYDACIELVPGLGSDFRAGIGRQTLPGGLYLMHQRPIESISGRVGSGLSPDFMLAHRDIALDPERSVMEEVALTDTDDLWTTAGHVLVPVASALSATMTQPRHVA